MAAAANVLRRTAEAFAHSGAHLWRNSVPAAAPATQLAPAWVFLGPPGVGKGTYSSRVAEALGIPHISAGDLVRDEIKSGSRHGQQVVAARPITAAFKVPASPALVKRCHNVASSHSRCLASCSQCTLPRLCT